MLDDAALETDTALLIKRDLVATLGKDKRRRAGASIAKSMQFRRPSPGSGSR
jgi:hypothetical protein